MIFVPQFLFRITKRKWDKLNVQWLQPNDIQADPLGDLRITDGTLSVWYIEDDRSNLGLIVTALAATRQKFDKFEYGLFDQNVLDIVDVLVKKKPGDTPIENANVWHRDLVELNIDKATTLVKTIFNGLEKKRLLPDAITARILDAVHAGDINLQKVNKPMREKISELRK